MYDSLVAQRLAENNKMYDSALKQRLDAVMSKERVLDKAPEKYTPVCQGMEFEPFGVYTIFRSIFTKYSDRGDGPFQLNIDGNLLPCDKKTYVVLRTLMDVGVSKSMARAMACRELFVDIVRTHTEAGLTIEEAVQALVFGDDYYKNEIVRACLDCLFSEKEQVKLRLRSILGNEYDDRVVAAIGDPTDVDELDKAIKQAYKKVCLNPEFRVKKNLGRAVNVARYVKEGFAL